LGGREEALILLALRGTFGGGLGIQGLWFVIVRGEVTRDESGGIGVLRFAERICFPGIRELVRVSARVAVEGSGVRVLPGNVRVERGGVSPVGGGEHGLSP